MSWKKQSSRSNTGKHTFVSTNTAFSDNPENIFPDTLDVLGDATFYKNVDICGDLTVGGSINLPVITVPLINVSNIFVSDTLDASYAIINNNLDVCGNVVIDGNLTVSGDLIFTDETHVNMNITNLLNASGVDISNNLNVTGNMILGGTVSGDYLFIDNVDNRIHIGNHAGQTGQNQESIAIGKNAGQYNQHQYAVAIGRESRSIKPKSTCDCYW